MKLGELILKLQAFVAADEYRKDCEVVVGSNHQAPDGVKTMQDQDTKLIVVSIN